MLRALLLTRKLISGGFVYKGNKPLGLQHFSALKGNGSKYKNNVAVLFPDKLLSTALICFH